MTRTHRATRLLLVVALASTVVVADPTATPADAQSLLLLWSRGSQVAQWQRQLNAVPSEDIAVDGIYGPRTAQATREFQASARITVDGIVGPQTRRAMRERVEGSAPSRDVHRKGDRGRRVRVLQSRLEELNYWVGGVDGVYGTLTRQAVIAFQKVNGLSPDGVAGPRTRSALDEPQPPQVRSSQQGLVMEVNKPQQILVSVWNGEVSHIWNTSTGTEEHYTYGGRRYLADTPEGQWEIYRQIDGWRESHLGRLYRPKYFHEDGIAIHGYHRVPAYPASHGCVRVSMEAMDYLWEALPIGTLVWVY
ncbi:MAG: peptidoglycan-binding protein [Actinomycetota bacterium]|nr:peptidoglycan-binding protein [Actinomycetota bacterium]